MKILTLNTHSLVEENYRVKTEIFIDTVLRERPDVIALQEVNQTIAEPAAEGVFGGYVPCTGNVTVRRDNHALTVSEGLRKQGLEYNWTWLPLKKGYDKFDEGIAIFSLEPILETSVIQISRADDYNDWKTRKALGIKSRGGWFYSVHTGWWGDEDDPFPKQWERLFAVLPKNERVWLMGDFNNPAEVRGEGYDLMLSRGWQDCYAAAEKKDGGITVPGAIDGWRDKPDPDSGMRIDLILCNEKVNIRSCRTAFDGVNEPVVSDHFGVIAETE